MTVFGHRNRVLYDTAIDLLFDGKLTAYTRSQLRRLNESFAEPLSPKELEHVLATARRALPSPDNRRLP